MDAQRAQRVGVDLHPVDGDPGLLGERVADVLGRDRAEGLALLAGFELEHQRDRVQLLGERLRVGVGALHLVGRAVALLRDAFELARACDDREAARQQKVLGVAVRDILDLARAAESADLLL